MPSTKRKHASGVIGRLFDRPQRFTFTQAVSLLLRALRRQGIGYERALRERIAFRNTLSLTFPPGEVDALTIEPRAVDAAAALRNGAVERIRLTPAFIGLLGVSGTLPLHDTERLAAREAHDADPSQRELLDVLSTRLVAMFYGAWAKYRVEHGLDVRGEDTLLPMLTSIAGAGSTPAPGTSRVKLEASAYFSGLLRTRPVASCTIEKILGDYFEVPVRLEQFVGCWDPIATRERSTLGVTKPVLGDNAVLGTRLWRHDRHARLHVGPLDEAQLREFLPGGAALAALADMASLFAVPALRYEVRLLLAPPCVRRLTLTPHTAPRKLGWNTFLTATEGHAERPDIRMMLPPSSARAAKRSR